MVGGANVWLDVRSDGATLAIEGSECLSFRLDRKKEH